MAYPAYLFDLDGTLLDTLGDLADSVNHVLRDRGLPTHPEDAYRRFVGDGVTALIARALPAADREDDATVATVEAAFRAWYAEHMAERTAPYPGIQGILDALASRGVPLGVLSNKPHEPTTWLVARAFPNVPFRVVFGARPGVPRKPDPTAALEAADHLGVAPSSVAFVGDSDTDVRTAQHAGMTAIGAGWGFRGPDELRDAGADVVCETVSALATLTAEGEGG